MSGSEPPRFAYTTLITRASYLAGVVILARTLKKHGSKYPLVVFYTRSLAESAVRALKLEATKSNLILRQCEPLLPRREITTFLIAKRFEDTWTKLRVFELTDYDTVCYLDADMAIFRSMDDIFDKVSDLPSDWLAANHTCVCNLDGDEWAPVDWTKENCAYTAVNHPEALIHPTPITPQSRPTYHLLNGGLFVFHPSKQLRDELLHFFNTTDKLSTYQFPDQDFLADYFYNRLRPMGWQYNAIKTMRYWHPNIWRDDEVVCLHYIVDKPWVRCVGEGGVAGYKGLDGETHRWWWDAYDDWEKQRNDSLDKEAQEVLRLVREYVAKPVGETNEWDNDPDMRAIGSQVQGT
jgi:inositol 3-alpha-galactosyltransferase